MNFSPSALSIDCTSEVEMHEFGAMLLQQAGLAEGVDLLHYHHPPAELPTSFSQQHLILINTNVSPDTQVEQVTEGKPQSAEMNLEQIIIVPAQVESSARWNRSHSYLSLCIKPSVFSHRANELIPERVLELQPKFAISDPLIRSIGLALKSETDSPSFGKQIYLDTLLTTLLTHLAKHHASSLLNERKTSGLSHRQLRRVVDHVQSSLDRNISLEELATVAGLSISHFSEQFKLSVGISPYRYVTQQRVEKAKVLLRRKDMRIAEVSTRLGFADQSHFTRHFKRATSVTPRKFRQSS
ncbi:MAG: AraC family transcriptional regulator [Cyanobacteria bacterium J06649_4]